MKEKVLMTTGRASAIFDQILSDDFTYKEKLKAINMIVDQPTHNGVTKASMLDVIKWLLMEMGEYLF